MEHASAPACAFDPHRDREWPFFLDRTGAVSFGGARPFSQLVVEASGRVRNWEDGYWRALDRHPIDAIAEYVDRNRAPARALPSELPQDACLPRTVGYFAYELGAFIEDVPVAGPDPAGLPLAVLSTYDCVDAWIPGIERAITVKFEDAGKRYGSPPPPLECSPAMAALPSPDDDRTCYRRAFARVQRAIRAGEIYQANLARRLDLGFDDDAYEAYRRLRGVQPVPQGAYLDLGARQILSNSPECFLSVRGGSIATFPIKGTRPRHGDAAHDREAAANLICDPKERAEHLMIVDLERSDLGRVCVTGSVDVPAYARVESFATVHHLVSAVRGTLGDGVGIGEILRATFPGGSITGAPKIRAIEIIAEVEPQARGVYTGAIGSFNGARACELNVAIRTAIVGGGRIQYCVGGGIVADSEVDSEYEETNVKARAFLAAVVHARSGMRAAQ
jgi:para-aminobenzoate synthetase component 1